MWNPGPCRGCGKSWDQLQAEKQLAEAQAALASMGPSSAPHGIGESVLAKLGDGDMITIEWSGQQRHVVVVIREHEVFLRDLSETESRQLADECAAISGEDSGSFPL